MIVVDTSAFIAMLTNEPEAEALALALYGAGARYVSAVTVYETRVVLLRRGDARYFIPFGNLLTSANLVLHTFDTAQSNLASDAYRRFGRGSGHPARLNLGDCASYALAMSLDAPLLYKGNDFSQTDVRSALAA
ncbi:MULTISPECIES: type II toxin-antitoxin system VapC family toxin [unclassified Chelatococcus]|uniref:type II toxin-antitoxin system VapC family toxin n=1 Tax=unclassified Chelatococcus TaxID=2638111 RepID=UPI000306E9F2|nr:MULTISPECIES: type II toxin-antitoxin system VapC family toxin [unclassified Chelatococcus]